VEAWLDRLAAALASGDLPGARAACAEAASLALAHYDREEPTLFARLEPHLPDFVRKLRLQHDEARELAAHLSNTGLPGAEWLQLARRFLAISQHNIIEEERDLFVLADRLR